METSSLGRYVEWSLLGLIILVGALIATSIVFLVYRSPVSYYQIFPFFPFHFGFLGIILLILIIFWIARWWFWSGIGGRRVYYSENSGEVDAILRKRYAKGEITREQFERMKWELKQHD
jgi:putative membrane protein